MNIDWTNPFNIMVVFATLTSAFYCCVRCLFLNNSKESATWHIAVEIISGTIGVELGLITIGGVLISMV